MQCACAILPSVACPTLQYFFPHFLIKGTIVEKKNMIGLERFVSIFLTFF